MILKMEKLALYGLSADREKLVRALMEYGCAQLRKPESLDEFEQLEGLAERQSLDLYSLEQRLARLSAAISMLSVYEKKPGLFAKKRRVAFDDYGKSEAMERAFAICDRAEAGQKEIANLKAARSRAVLEIEALTPWSSSDLPLEIEETERTELQYVVYGGREPRADFESAVTEAGGAAVLVSEQGAGICYVVLSHKADRDAVGEAMRAFSFTRAPFPEMYGAPQENIARLENEISAAEKVILDVEECIANLAYGLEDLKLAYDSTLLDIDCAGAGGNLLHTERTFIMTAWVPEKDKETVEKFLSGYACYYDFSPSDPSDPEMPVVLKNPKWAEPFDTITEMYSMPLPGSLDPGPFVAPFYFIFFGMMLSDAGYGLVILLGCLFAIKFMDLGKNAKKMMKMLAMCGVSTIIWGLLYGSVFGDAIEVFMRSFFNIEFILPKIIDPMNQPIAVLILSMALGLIHIMVGMGLKAYLMIKRGHPWDAVFDVGFWYMVFIGFVMLVAGGTVGKIGMWMAIAGAVGLVCTQGRDKKNLFGKISSGVLSLYDVTGYFSDVLSYSRILALGLATGVIGSVINIIGTLPGPNILGAIVFVIVFIGGHLFNLAINALGSYVHTARLQYVEFFGKFYEGGGKPFCPLAATTKYTHAAVLAGEEKE